MRIANLNTDTTVLHEIGRRVEAVRLDRNITQDRLAHEAGVSRSTVLQLESGRSVSLSSFVRILRALGLLESLDRALPEELPSPIERLKREGRRRQRASSPRAQTEKGARPGTWSWPTGGTT